MTGWRIGYDAGPEKLIKAMIKIQGQSTSNPSSISQYAAMAGIGGSKDFLKPCLDAFDERRHFVVNKLNSIPGIITNGIFANRKADTLLVGTPSGLKIFK